MTGEFSAEVARAALGFVDADPSFEIMRISSCDLGSMIFSAMFREFALPLIKEEVKHFRHNIYHLDGKGVAVHLEDILTLHEVQAIQWVQGTPQPARSCGRST